ncbi:MAG: DNA polymerase I [Prevotellaceae bacterium]|nr:DNA polymerase I [Prevotellaceae bacterium]
MKKLFLLDAYALIYRSYYAFINRPITNSKGLDTSAIFGFARTLMDVLKKEKPTHIAVVFDSPGKNFRHDLYPEYKANRQQTPETIKTSVPIIKSLIEAFNIPVVCIPGYEADDIAGTMAKLAEKHDFTTYLMTPDKDYGQLVSPTVFMYKPNRSGNGAEILGEKEVCDQYSIQSPRQVIDILAIWGDASDNVPGVKGVGEKGATKLIAEFGSVENILENLDQLKGKQKEAFEQDKEQVMLSKKLITIDCNVPVEWNEEQLKLTEPNLEELRKLYTELEFAIMLRELNATAQRATATPAQTNLFEQGQLFAAGESTSPSLFKTIKEVEHEYKLAATEEEVTTLAKLLSEQKEICIDTETEGLDTIEDKLVGLSFSIKPHTGYYVPIHSNHNGSDEFLEILRPVLESEKVAKIGQNIKFDYLMLKSHGITMRGFFFDTMIADYLNDPDSNRHNMKVLSEKFLEYTPVDIEELIGPKGKGQRKMSQVPLEQICKYAAEDVDVTVQLKEKLEEELEKNELTKLYSEIEAPLISVLADMEFEGIRIDANGLQEFGKTLSDQLLALDEEIRQMAGEPSLNISSPKQLGIVLFEKLKINSGAKKTKTKQYSTSEETLLSLQDRHPIIGKILEYRSLKKLLSSYVESLPQLVNKKTDKIHTSFNQAVTATGRLSSNNPNLQNIPIREENGREIRRAFISSDDNHVLLSADYSQIELRLMAHMSGDPNLIEAFMSDEDIHTATAAKVFHVKPGEVTKEQRSKAKTANFGIIYGISTFGLAQRLQIPRGEAKELIDGYFASYPKVKEYMDNVKKQAAQDGYVSTIFGRKRWLRDINSANAIVRGLAERNAINAPLQGSAADIIKIAMINIHKQIEQKELKSRMILQVHDELVFDAEKSELNKLKEIVIHEMENAAQLRVPLTVETGFGLNWLEAH